MAAICRLSLSNFLTVTNYVRIKLPVPRPAIYLLKSMLMKPTTFSFESRCYSNKTAVTDEIDDDSKPVKFSTSDAAKWKAEYSRRGEAGEDDSPPSQPYVVVFSTFSFLIYFCILREESDIDMKIAGGEFNDPYLNLEETQLKVIVEDNKSRNVETDQKILIRLKELEELKINAQ